MSKDPSKTRLCSECKRPIDALALRPLGYTRKSGGVRFACPQCYGRVMSLRKTVREACAYSR